MATFQAGAMLQYVATLVTNLAGIQQVYIGVPESIDSRVSAYVTIGDLTPKQFLTGIASREPVVLVTFAYRVAGAEQTAELLICDLVDEFTQAIYNDRTLGGTSQDAVLDMTMSTQPAYMAVAGAEFRRYIVLVRGLQLDTTP